MEAIGRPETVKQAFLSIRKGGKAIAIGIGAPNAEIPIPAQWLVYGERTLCGCFYGSARVRLEFERMIRISGGREVPVIFEDGRVTVGFGGGT